MKKKSTWERLDFNMKCRVIAIGLCVLLGLVNGFTFFLAVLGIIAIFGLLKAFGGSNIDLSSSDEDEGYRDGDQGYGYYSHDGVKIHD
ncbi:hypothetical protein [Gallibacterium genomosp. 3]|uniref:Uncharacterized protein n=1 Tax=Gallibacterium genomosp. 3 TaxID=505345 RepID=A0A1A7Q007_9PAST|nr:hypothetical protein [Gallibacterium genomosp. 3]OBX07366.1 hypothetical protein QV07_07025 [Gallibacterium genomosp. 3]